MDLFGEKQKTKIFLDLGFETNEADCFIKKISSDKIVLQVFPNSDKDFAPFKQGNEIDVKIFTPKGIAIFKSIITGKLSDKELEIKVDEKKIKVEDTRQNPRYNAKRPLTVFRPLKGNIDGELIDISVRGLRFFCETSLEENSEFEIMLYLSETIGKIIFTGRILDKTGLPDGVHRMIIEDISYDDRQKLVDFCMSLAK